MQAGYWSWPVTLEVINGHLVPKLQEHPRDPSSLPMLTLREDQSCSMLRVPRTAEYFIPDRAKGRLEMSTDQELWVEVTVPPQGPPRPIQLAVSDRTGFRPLRFE